MKTILVTGAAGDMGKSIISRLSQEKNEIIAVVKTKESGESLKGMERVSVHVADVTNVKDLKKLKDKLPEKIDWLVTAHGYIDPETDLIKESPENIEKTFQVNTISLLYLAQTFVEHTNKGFIFISSTSGISANGRYAAYSASKAGTNSLAQAFARNRTNQTFISLCPGPTAGKMRASIGATGGQDPDEIAKTVSTIVGDANPYKSGDILMVRDGKTTVEAKIN